MNGRFVLHTARRELRGGGHRLGIHMAAVAVGVAALVAIGGFRADLERSLAGQGRALLGADLQVRSNRPFPEAAAAVIDSFAALYPSARVTTFASMALAPASGLARLVQVEAVERGYPFYGRVTTEPPARWRALGAGGVLVDPTVLAQLDLALGSTLRIGASDFTVLGTVTDRPGDLGLQTAIGGRVFIGHADLAATGLLTYGSRAYYERFFVAGDNRDIQRFLNRHHQLLTREQVRFETANDQEADLARATDMLARFLGLVGLTALLLGGVGVASAVHVFVRQRLETVATLRCLGARQDTVFTAFVLVAMLLAVLGAGIGVLLGVAIQFTLPSVLGEFLPVPVTPIPSATAALNGIAISLWTALLFALMPLLALRNTPPLRALRRDVEPARRDRWRWVVGATLGGTVVALSLSQAPDRTIGWGFAAAVFITAGVLWLVAAALVGATRRLVPRRLPWVMRQGIANLYRPRNQTVAVTLALGFGVFLLATLWVVQRNLLDQFSLDRRSDRPTLVLFDVQTAQLGAVRKELERHGLPSHDVTPIVSARLAAINGVAVADLLSDSSAAFGGQRWALRREYRHTWRDSLTASETLIKGAWWDVKPGKPAPDPLPRISVAEDIRRDLGVTLGDTLTWNVQGVAMPSVIASVRRVEWARFEPNFFVVFEPGALADAPTTWVVLTRADSARVRGMIQRTLASTHPNVLTLDLTTVHRALERVLGRVAVAIRFMALFSIAAGLLILVGALASSRAQRQSEVVLLKTLGARLGQVRRILLTEYAALGALGALAGILLACVAGWLTVRHVFDIGFRLPVLSLALAWIGTAGVTVAVGVLTSGKALTRPPLEALRTCAD